MTGQKKRIELTITMALSVAAMRALRPSSLGASARRAASTLPSRVRIVEVGPRDGLQNEPLPLSAATKVELCDRLSATGLRTIEAASFVSPKWVPQMASAAEVMGAIARAEGVSYPALAPNARGYADAHAAGAEEVAVFTAASDGFSLKNTNCTVEEGLELLREVCVTANADGVRVRGYVSCVVGCPFDGAVAPEHVAHVSKQLLEMGCYEVSLGDTIGVGTARSIGAMLDAVLAEVPAEQVAIHCHNTYGQAIANILASLQRGVSVVDSSVAGLGGCPYAPGASGNVATEEVMYLLQGMGIETGT